MPKNRPDKKFFKVQVQIVKEGLFDKKVPTWASDLKLLSQVVRVQYKQMRGSYFELFSEDLRKKNIVGEPHPISFSWSRMDEIL